MPPKRGRFLSAFQSGEERGNTFWSGECLEGERRMLCVGSWRTVSTQRKTGGEGPLTTQNAEYQFSFREMRRTCGNDRKDNRGGGTTDYSMRLCKRG